MFLVNNIKVSYKISNLHVSDLLTELKIKKLDYSETSKYIIIRTNFTYIICKTKNNLINHVNVSKIPHFHVINDAILFFKDSICENLKLISKNIFIDNITATFKHNENINLKNILNINKHLPIKYNKEKFPGLFLKLSKCTLLIFHTGKVNSVGCKSAQDLIESFNDLTKILKCQI